MMSKNNCSVYMYTPHAEGGHARYTHELLEALHKLGLEKGLEVNLITSSDLQTQYRNAEYTIHDILPPLELQKDFPTVLHRIIFRVSFYWRREKTFMKWITSLNRNKGNFIVHFQGYTPWLAVRHFNRLRKQKIITFYTVHNIYPHSYPPLLPKNLYNRLNYSAWHECDGLIVHTEKLKTRLIEFLGKNSPPVFVAPHGIWKTEQPPEKVKQLKASDKNQKRLLFFGVLRPNKGLHLLLRAMKHLPGFSLTIAGSSCDNRYMENINGLIKELEPGRVELIDRYIEASEMKELFGLSSIMVLPYTSFASQSGVLHDALAYNLPVVVTDVGGVGETVRNLNIGEVVPPEDPKALAGAVEKLLRPNRYTEVLESISGVQKEQTWTKCAEATYAAYNSVTEVKTVGKIV